MQRAPERSSSGEIAVWRRSCAPTPPWCAELEADLLGALLPLASYDVLVQLVEAPEHRLRMTDLADAVLLSRSGLTRLIDRLEREGLVAARPARATRADCSRC